jgi:hypothetical protein
MVRLWDNCEGKYWGKRKVYHGVVNELGDRDTYFYDRKHEKILLGSSNLEVYFEDRDKIIQEE